mmetsp:Transcript_35686/g.112140  ORF Transcript_35686/g.112140 Transcript_35686/m.112140 type:complete len:139 (+) Transcript_35686:761-1177(+)
MFGFFYILFGLGVVLGVVQTFVGNLIDQVEERAKEAAEERRKKKGDTEEKQVDAMAAVARVTAQEGRIFYHHCCGGHHSRWCRLLSPGGMDILGRRLVGFHHVADDRLRRPEPDDSSQQDIFHLLRARHGDADDGGHG